MHFSTTLDENLRVSCMTQLSFDLSGRRCLARSVRRAKDVLLHRQRTDIVDKRPDQGLTESRIVQVQDILDDIVAKGVLHEVERVKDDFSDELHPLGRRCVIDGALQDAAAVSVGSDFDEIGSDGVVDELVVFGDELVEALLDHL